jgi:hypothetical protein
MKFATVKHGDRRVPAVVVGDEAVLLPEGFSDLVAFIEAGEEARVVTALSARRSHGFAVMSFAAAGTIGTIFMKAKASAKDKTCRVPMRRHSSPSHPIP